VNFLLIPLGAELSRHKFDLLLALPVGLCRETTLSPSPSTASAAVTLSISEPYCPLQSIPQYPRCHYHHPVKDKTLLVPFHQCWPLRCFLGALQEEVK